VPKADDAFSTSARLHRAGTSDFVGSLANSKAVVGIDSRSAELL
jgi:hypothetical protein